jgi:hypothetical protein
VHIGSAVVRPTRRRTLGCPEGPHPRASREAPWVVRPRLPGPPKADLSRCTVDDKRRRGTSAANHERSAWEADTTELITVESEG